MEKKKKWVSFFAAFVLLALFVVIIRQNHIHKENNDFVASTTFAMSTVIEQKWYGKKSQATLDEVNAMLRDFDNSISVYVDNSEISQINKNAGEVWTEVSTQTYEMLQRAYILSQQSQGVFDITIQPLVELWKISSENPYLPTQSEIESALSFVNLSNLLMRESEGRKEVLLREKGMAIDLGGIAKGMAASMVQEIALRNNTNGYASIGGNLVVMGKKPDGSDFKFGLRNPRGTPSEYVGTLTLEGKTMATTGDYERYFERDGVRYHHILSPKTGKPFDTDLISLTVICEDGGLADFLSTTIFSLGLETAKDCLEREDFGMIAIDKDYNVYVSTNLKERFSFQDSSGNFLLVS